jgi:hypothetical protein
MLLAFFYMDIYLGDAVTALENSDYVTTSMKMAAIFPVLRAIFLVVLILAFWRTNVSAAVPKAINQKLILYLLVICVIMDCALFQIEYFSHLPLFRPRVSLPVLKPSFNWVRSDQVPSKLASKSEVWFANVALGLTTTEYQITTSSSLQLDPPAPHFKTEWYPRNVWEMQKVMDKDSVDYKVICGIDNPKFRVLTETQYVATDQDALKLLQSQKGWNGKLILTVPDAKNDAGMKAAPAKDLLIDPASLTQFSANTVKLDVNYTLPQPGWLVYADAYSPNWRAQINGTPVQVLEAYGAFKALRLNPGLNHVHLFYDKGFASFCLSLFVVTAGGAAAVALLYLFWLALKEPFQMETRHL